MPSRAASSMCAAAPWAMSASSCGSSRASRPRCRGRADAGAAAPRRGGAAQGRVAAGPTGHPRPGSGRCRRDLLRRRAAAGEHRALAYRRLSDPAARRADRLARLANRDGVIDLIREAATQGAAIVGIFHDAAVREAVATRLITSPCPEAPHDAETIFTNGRIVTADAEFDGTVVVRDGRIADVATGRSGPPARSISRATTLIPGLIELHTDNMEKHFAPRPGVKWPAVPAVMAHDAQIAAGRHHHRVRFAVAGRRARRHRPRAEPHPHGRGDLRGERAPHDPRRAPPAPALRGHARRRGRGGRPVDRPAAGRPDVDQRPHAGPAPVPRSGQAQAILHGQVPDDRRSSSRHSTPARSTCTTQRRAPSRGHRVARPGPRPAARQPRRRHARACARGGAATA